MRMLRTGATLPGAIRMAHRLIRSHRLEKAASCADDDAEKKRALNIKGLKIMFC